MNLPRKILHRAPEILVVAAFVIGGYFLIGPGKPPSTGGPQADGAPLVAASSWTPRYGPGRHSTPMSDGRARCTLCPRECELAPGQRGFCRVRENRDGQVVSVVHESAILYDQERFPLSERPFTLHDFSGVFVRIGGVGCTMRCSFCLTGHETHADPGIVPLHHAPAADVIALVDKYGSNTIAFTGNEPTLNFDYTLEIATLARARGITTFLSTNAFLNPEPFDEMLSQIDCVAVGIKGFTEETYARHTTGALAPVLHNLLQIRRRGIDLELMYVLVPGVNDDMGEIAAMSTWIKENLGEYVPLHFLRFIPAFEMKHLPRTSAATMLEAMRVARAAGLKFVIAYPVDAYTPEILAAPELTTMACPFCSEALTRYTVEDGEAHVAIHHTDGRCDACNEEIPGVIRALARAKRRTP